MAGEQDQTASYEGPIKPHTPFSSSVINAEFKRLQHQIDEQRRQIDELRQRLEKLEAGEQGAREVM